MEAEHSIVESLVGQIFAWVRSHGTYVPRDYQTIGGAWTVDTWQLGDVKVQLADEGYTQRVVTDNLIISQTYGRVPQWDRGTLEDLRFLHSEILQETI